ncbi:haloacid dehalogenase type II [Arthrobacter sp. SO3]|uniref:haloacid dehalogenase type II n=1 Tax=Arthrobacter sp. SO3 TaxID=1897057 RepID=UPI001CFFEE1A|nr:haloacid dehalogenase type II [Arthrobacter sp. SO3]MCB5290982.1 Haloacetate dehalogenase H-2 [Arthrobacter sp. SO3]
MSIRPAVIVFDVNETLSDMSVMGGRFAETGAPSFLAKVWFTGVLRDGFALAAAGDRARFAEIAADLLRVSLAGLPLNRSVEAAVVHIMSGLAELALHPDVVGGVWELNAAGFRLVTLSNGSPQVAEKLLGDAGIRGVFEALLSVEDGPSWKPVATAYTRAARTCSVEPEQMLLVAVHPWDIHGAARAGMRTAWINRADAPYPAYFTPPEITLGSLRELAPFLENSLGTAPVPGHTAAPAAPKAKGTDRATRHPDTAAETHPTEGFPTIAAGPAEEEDRREHDDRGLTTDTGSSD